MKVSKKGFTLAELMCVLLIITIVSVIAAPNIIKYIDKSKRNSCKAIMQSLIDDFEYELTVRRFEDAAASDMKLKKCAEKKSDSIKNGDNAHEMWVKGICPNGGEYHILWSYNGSTEAGEIIWSEIKLECICDCMQNEQISADFKNIVSFVNSNTRIASTVSTDENTVRKLNEISMDICSDGTGDKFTDKVVVGARYDNGEVAVISHMSEDKSLKNGYVIVENEKVYDLEKAFDPESELRKNEDKIIYDFLTGKRKSVTAVYQEYYITDSGYEPVVQYCTVTANSSGRVYDKNRNLIFTLKKTLESIDAKYSGAENFPLDTENLTVMARYKTTVYTKDSQEAVISYSMDNISHHSEKGKGYYLTSDEDNSAYSDINEDEIFFEETDIYGYSGDAYVVYKDCGQTKNTSVELEVRSKVRLSDCVYFRTDEPGNYVYLAGYIGESDIVTVPFSVRGYWVMSEEEAEGAGEAYVEYNFQDGTKYYYVDDRKIYFISRVGKYSSGMNCSSGENTIKTDQANIRDLRFEDGIKDIGPECFADNSSIRRVTFGRGLVSIGRNAFSNCSNISGDLLIPSTVESIGTAAFMNCSGFDGVLSLENVKTIGAYAFSGCTHFCGGLTIPYSMCTIGMAAFMNFASESRREGPLIFRAGTYNDGTEIGAMIFHGSKFKNVIIDGKVSRVDNAAFQSTAEFDYSKFTGDLIFLGDMKTIGDNAFGGCSGFDGKLDTGKVESIGSSAFDGCSISPACQPDITADESVFSDNTDIGSSEVYEETVSSSEIVPEEME